MPDIDDLLDGLAGAMTAQERRVLAQAQAQARVADLRHPDQPSALLRFEATDLYGRIMDTVDLSVVRGASTMLDVFFDHLDQVMGDCCADPAERQRLQVVFTGGSQAVVLVHGGHAPDALVLANRAGQRLVATLSRDPWRWTCAYATAWLDGDFIDIVNRLEGQVLLRRLTQLDVDPGADHSGHGVPGAGGALIALDPVDDLRPVPASARPIQTRRGGGRPLYLSPANAFRFRFGQRHRFGLSEKLYAIWCQGQGLDDLAPEPEDGLAGWESMARTQWAPSAASRAFQQDFQALGRASRMPGYMAVIEGDGNGFGAWRQSLRTPEHLALGSLLISMAVRRTLVAAGQTELADMHAQLHSPADQGKPGTQQLQLLTFAGDEFVVALPGHRGLQFARAFLAHWTPMTAALWRLDHFTPLREADGVPPLHDCTFRLGVVITHASTPIRHVRDAAHELMELSAKRTLDVERKSDHVLDWAVLKSHDIPPSGVCSMRRQVLGAPRGPATARPQTLAEFTQVHDLAHSLRQAGMPQRQLARRAQWCARPTRGDPPPWSPDAGAALQRLPASTLAWVSGSQADAVWTDLYEMMDVVGAERHLDEGAAPC